MVANDGGAWLGDSGSSVHAGAEADDGASLQTEVQTRSNEKKEEGAKTTSFQPILKKLFKKIIISIKKMPVRSVSDISVKKLTGNWTRDNFVKIEGLNVLKKHIGIKIVHMLKLWINNYIIKSLLFYIHLYL